MQFVFVSCGCIVAKSNWEGNFFASRMSFAPTTSSARYFQSSKELVGGRNDCRRDSRKIVPLSLLPHPRFLGGNLGFELGIARQRETTPIRRRAAFLSCFPSRNGLIVAKICSSGGEGMEKLSNCPYGANSVAQLKTTGSRNNSSVNCVSLSLTQLIEVKLLKTFSPLGIICYSGSWCLSSPLRFQLKWSEFVGLRSFIQWARLLPTVSPFHGSWFCGCQLCGDYRGDSRR